MLTAGKDFEGCGLLAVLFESQSTGYLHSLIFLLVHTALCLLYGFILRVAFKQARAVGAYDHFRNTTNDVSMTSAEHVTQARVVEARLKLKAVLRMGGVFVMSFVCWTPYAIVCLTGPQKASREVMLTTFYLISFNSAGNFCIYALADREFRAALAKMLRLAASDRNSASANSGSIDLAAP
nr:hypothetical protein BaRGS_014722 [Batillaria attramentaria]